MEYVRVERNKVVELISSSTAINKENLIEADLSGGIDVGDDIRMFTPDWKLRPVQELVDEGLIVLKVSNGKNSTLPSGVVLEKVKDGKIVDKTKYDFAVAGDIELGDYDYIDKKTKTIKTAETVDELVEYGEISKEKAESLKAKEIRSKREELLGKLDVVVSNPLRWDELSETQKEEMKSFRRLLLDITDQDFFPHKVSWPELPSVLKVD